MRFVQRDLSGSLIKDAYPSALCLILADVPSAPSASYFMGLKASVAEFEAFISSNKDMSSLLNVAFGYTGDIRTQDATFREIGHLMIELRNEMTNSPLAGEDLGASCRLLTRKREQWGSLVAPSLFLVVLSEEKIDYAFPGDITCLWAVDYRKDSRPASSSLIPLASDILRQMERRIA